MRWSMSAAGYPESLVEATVKHLRVYSQLLDASSLSLRA